MISIQYDSPSDGKLDVGVVRTDQTNVAGFGQIGELVLKIASNLSGGPTSMDTLLFTISDLSVIANNENTLNTNITNASLIVVDAQTGIDYKEYENYGLLIYPNPNTGQFTIIPNNPEQLGTLNLIVYQINGHKVLEETLTKQVLKIDLTQFSKGVYYLQLKSDKGILTRKIIVQ